MMELLTLSSLERQRLSAELVGVVLGGNWEPGSWGFLAAWVLARRNFRVKTFLTGWFTCLWSCPRWS